MQEIKTFAGFEEGVEADTVYQRRRPERTAAYQVVRQNLETWLARRRAGGLDPGADWSVYPVPAYIERDLQKFLQCGILANGFARARCEKCGQDFLAAYSCKGRRVCASCNTRRMVETAAYMVDMCFRQWLGVVNLRCRNCTCGRAWERGRVW